ncbi:ABC transporter permease [Labrys wisconsinensis]|uniref:Simple sugar transport system permease protein n=1 Tax=Labrys wisconsinensis TaxID=425677 RepID=A0ABU0JPX3_9HYPH|nr:ABC transporter permease [Labrys wisconsinensis]MDQ0475319.1 simple sugar transport system permease protein [Labrys wisconsinensis]
MSTIDRRQEPADARGRRAAPSRDEVESLVLVPLVAILAALALGAIGMLATGVDLPTTGRALAALAAGSVGSVGALSETLTAAAPLTLAGLGIALGFRAGLFNIGAEGQMLVGGMAAVLVGFAAAGLPAWIHLPLALAAAMAAGGLWGGVAGWLRAATGAHEVISTIMLNFVALRLVDYLLRSGLFRSPGRSDPVSQSIAPSAELPRLLAWLDPNLRVHAGVLLALAMVVLMSWLLFRTKLGFEFRAAGASPSAAHYAGIRTGAAIVAAMTLAGALAGLAGANQILGVLGRATPAFSSNLGFTAIAVALLGRSHPVGVLLAGLLFGALEAGGRQMQVSAGVSVDLVAIIQALIVAFIAAPVIVRTALGWAFPARPRPPVAAARHPIDRNGAVP